MIEEGRDGRIEGLKTRGIERLGRREVDIEGKKKDLGERGVGIQQYCEREPSRALMKSAGLKQCSDSI